MKNLINWVFYIWLIAMAILLIIIPIAGAIIEKDTWMLAGLMITIPFSAIVMLWADHLKDDM